MSLPIERGMQQQPGNLALQFRSGAIAETVLKCIPERGTPDVCSTRKHKHRHSKIPAAGLSGFSPWVRCIVLLSTCWLLFELLYSILWRCIFALGWRCSVECQRVGRHPWAPKGHCAIPLRHKMSGPSANIWAAVRSCHFGFRCFGGFCAFLECLQSPRSLEVFDWHSAHFSPYTSCSCSLAGFVAL